LWLLSCNTRDERQIRALEFSLEDIRSYVAWVGTVRAFPQNQNLSAVAQAQANAEAVEMDRRQDWIVQQANPLLNPTKPFTQGSFAQRTSDAEMVKVAGNAIPAGTTGGYDPAITLLNTWQTMSGFAHARPWATPGREITGTDPITGRFNVT
jgi:fructose-specific component phosphotransferase system IIB-like protein